MSGSGRCGVYTEWTTTQLYKNLKLDICDNINRTVGDYAKRISQKEKDKRWMVSMIREIQRN